MSVQPSYPDPADQRLISPEWDTLFGFMVGRLLANGYTPAQIQVKTRGVTDLVRGISRTAEGEQASADLEKGFDNVRRLIDEEGEGGD